MILTSNIIVMLQPFRRYGVLDFLTYDIDVTLTLTPRHSTFNLFIFGLKYTNNQSLVKFRPVVLEVDKANKCIFSMLEPTVILNFDLSIRKS